MDKQEIITRLQQQHEQFIALLQRLSPEDFTYTAGTKWTAGQQLQHILLSVSPVTLALGLPKFLPRLLFGKANRPSKDYEGLVAKYQSKLASGGKAPKPFRPAAVSIEKKTALMAKLRAQVEKLAGRAAKYSETDLDRYILPHPLMGKITVREMLYFTIYHVQHHHKQVTANLQKLGAIA